MTDVNSLKGKIHNGFVSYRLNHQETLAAVNGLKQLQAAPADQKEALATSLAATVDAFLKEDQHPELPTGAAIADITAAAAELGLPEQVASLTSNKVWSAEQKAIYRRFHDLQNSPDLGTKVASKGEQPLLTATERNFSRWDADKNGVLSTVELDRAMASNDNVGEDAAALATLRRYFKDLDKVDSKTQGVAMSDLQGYLIGGIPEDGETTARINVSYPGMVKKASLQKEAPAFEAENFDPKTVRQGRPGTCVLLSTTAALSADEVRSMFEDNHNGTYTVTFKDGKHYDVQEPGFGDRLYHAQSANQGRWPELLELAMGQRIAETISKGDKQPRSVIDGIAPQEAIRAMSGKDFQQVSLENISIDETRKAVTELLGQGGPVICGSRNRKGAASEEGKALEAQHNGVANNHAYTVLDYNVESDQITLRNPWGRGEWNGSNDGVNDGTFQMPLADFYSNYRWVGGAVSPDHSRSAPGEFEPV